MKRTVRGLRDHIRLMWSRNHGYAVAEFAVMLPAVIFLMTILLWLLNLCFTQIQLETSAGTIARQLSRDGADAAVIEHLRVKETKVTTNQIGNVIEVKVSTIENFPIKQLNWSVHLVATSNILAENE